MGEQTLSGASHIEVSEATILKALTLWFNTNAPGLLEGQEIKAFSSSSGNYGPGWKIVIGDKPQS